MVQAPGLLGFVSYCDKDKKGYFLMVSALCLFGRSDRLLEQCSIALVGKYIKFSDSYASVIKALEHSALAISHKLEVKVSETFNTAR